MVDLSVCTNHRMFFATADLEEKEEDLLQLQKVAAELQIKVDSLILSETENRVAGINPNPDNFLETFWQIGTFRDWG
jgi:hypothetical protein